MFQRADYLLNGPATPAKNPSANAVVISSPVGVRRNIMEYYKYKYESASKQLHAVLDTSVALENVDGMLSEKKFSQKKLKWCD